MRIQLSMVHCLTCKHEWLAEMVVDAPVEVATASMMELRCQSCGVGPKKIAFGRGNVPDPQPVQSSMTDAEKRAAWRKLHDSGLSSECIADQMCGMVPSGCYPHDGDDFGRCERLLILYPEWRARMDEMRSVNKVWSALVDKWEEIVLAWRHDLELLKRPSRPRDGYLCSRLMRSIIDPVEREESS